MADPDTNNISAARVIWRGDETLASLVTVIERHGHADLELAPNLHHSLFVRLYPDALLGQFEKIDIHGEIELLTEVTKLGGLDCLKELVPYLRSKNIKVRIKSPTPTLHFYLPKLAELGSHH